MNSSLAGSERKRSPAVAPNLGRSNSFAPIAARTAGRTNCSKETNTETGFPGSPKNCAPPSNP